jgi:putative flippase GtrA
MEQSLLDRNLEEELSESTMEEALEAQVAAPAASPLPSYRPTPWAIVNTSLDLVDRYSGGRAGWVQRFFSFAFIGGCAALVNLLVFYIMRYSIKVSANEVIQNTAAFLVATEIAIMANFIPNDYFTFRHIGGHHRSWLSRCLRFHTTAVGGTILTFAIQSGLHLLLHFPATASQAIALILVLFYNFSAHHFFTYRHAKTAHS